MKLYNNENISIRNIIFSIKYDTKFGEEIGILGSNQSLGKWDVNRSLLLRWNDGNIWKGVIFNENEDFEFKFVVLNNGKVKIWEPGSNNEFQNEKLKEEIKNKNIGTFQKYEYSYDQINGELTLNCKWNN